MGFRSFLLAPTSRRCLLAPLALLFFAQRVPVALRNLPEELANLLCRRFVFGNLAYEPLLFLMSLKEEFNAFLNHCVPRGLASSGYGSQPSIECWR